MIRRKTLKITSDAALLDTQILTLIEDSPERISATAKDFISSGEETYLSIASVWEMAIKIEIGKLSLKRPLPICIEDLNEGHSFKLLPVSLAHIYHTQQLPLHHRDPFDRLLIAQASTENFSVISSNAAWDAYGINRIWS